MDKTEKILKIGASLIAIVIPCMLLAGFSFHLGYITSFGLSDELIPKSMSDVLVESWYVGVMAIAWLLSFWPYILCLFFFYFFLGTGFFLYLRKLKNEGVTWIFDDISKENQGKMIFRLSQYHWVCLGELFNDLTSLFLTPVTFLAIIGLFTAFPYTSGNEYAEKQIAKFNECGCQLEDKTFSCIRILDTSNGNRLIAHGILVSANESKVAIFNHKLEIWPLLDSYIIENDVRKVDITVDTEQEQTISKK